MDRSWQGNLEPRLRALIEQIPAIVYTQSIVADGAGAPRDYVSPQVEAILGYTPEEWTEAGSEGFWLGVIHPADRERVSALNEEADRVGRPFRAEYRVIARDGRTVWIRDEGVPIQDPDTDQLVFQGVMFDITEAQLAEQQLHEVEGRLRTLVEHIPAVTFMDVAGVDARETPTFYISPQIETLTGYTAEEWVADNSLWEKLLHPDDRERVIAVDAERYSADEPYILEYRLIRRDGQVVWVHDETDLLRDDEGVPLYWMGTMFDVTETKLAEQRLSEAEARLRMLIEHMHAVTFIDMLEGEPNRPHTIYINPQVKELTGYSAEEWQADDSLWANMIHPDDRERVLRSDRESYLSDSVNDNEYRIVRRDGGVVWVHDVTERLLDTEGRPIYWMGTLNEITALKLAEQQVRAAEERFRTLVEQIPVVVYVDEIGSWKTLYVSPQLEGFLGYTPQGWMADDGIWERSIHPDDRERVMAADDEVEENPHPFLERYRMVTRDGRTVWVEDRCVPVFEADGAPGYWHGVFFDITEQKRAESLERELQIERETSQKLRELDEMKNTFLSAVSHDLRTPLTSILGLGSTLTNPEIELTDQDRLLFVQRIMANARKLNDLVTDLLDLDRLSSGVVEPSRRPADLGELVARVAHEQQAIAEDHIIQVDVESVVIPMDGPKIERIVENLISNAVRHTPEGTHISARVRGTPEGALITVEDDGQGIPEDMHEAIFEAFRQIPGGRLAHGPGVGIGLALVRRLAELHGGRAWVEQREGGGASFRVLLPSS